MTDRPRKEPSILDEPSVFSKPSPRTFNRNNLPAQDLEQLRAENARLRRRLADCIVWMDTREEAQPGMPRLCDMARAALSADPAPVVDAWQPIETAPHATPVLLYCPDRGCSSNRERIELGCYSTGERVGHTSTMSYHSWATYWMPLPKPPAGENGND